MEIYTIGHSTHTKEKFTEMLFHNKIQVLADVWAFPGSKKHPQFSKDEFPAWLRELGIDYYHMEKLGGRRRKSKEIDSELNGAWKNQSFHNYADYSLSDSFREGISELTNLAAEKRVAYCWSEWYPSLCHRLIVSNWLQVNGWTVKHIIDKSKNQIEVVEQWGAHPEVREDGSVIYPVK